MTAAGPLRAGFEDLGSARWAQTLSSLRHDVYHIPSYLGFAARRQEIGTAIAFIAEQDDHRFFVPLIVRRIPDALAGRSEPIFDATCPRGYPGALIETGPGRAGDDFVDRAMEAFHDRLRERSIVTAFVRLHPLLLPPLAQLRQGGRVVEHGASVSIDLTLSADDMWRQTRTNHRRDIGRAKKQGMVARIDEDWSRFDDFVDVYQQSMVRLGADDSWRLSHEYLADLRASLGGLIHLCVAETGTDLAAAAILTEVDGIVEYHLAGTADAHVADSPSKLVVDFVRQWARSRANRIFHLAGSVRSGDSLSHFKAGFSPLRHPVASWRIVSDAPAYAGLIKHWDSSAGTAVPGSDDYFPAYRRPRTVVHES